VTGSATDPAGANDTLTLAWSVSGPGGFTANGSGPSITFTPPDDGAYVVSLVASDEDGGTVSATMTINVIDNVAPTAAITSTAPAVTNASPIPVTVTFSEPVTGLTEADVVVGNGTVTGFTGSGDTYTFNVTPLGQGAVTVDVGAGAGQDTAGNGNTAATRLTCTFDTTGPMVNISGPSVPVTGSGPVTFTITYPDADFAGSTLGTGDITLNTTGTANGTISSVIGTGNTRTVTISGITGDGTLGISIDAGTATDTVGNPASAAGPSATVNVDRDKPSVTISAPSQTFAKTGDSVTYTITYTDTTLQNVTLTTANVTLVKTGSAKGTVQVTGSGNTRTVTISNITGNGTLGISIKAGTAIDAIGQKAPAAGPSQKFVVDNIVPKVTIGSPIVTARKLIFTTAVDYIITITDTNLSPVTLTASDITLMSASGVTATKVVTKIDETRYRVSLSNFSGQDSIWISVAAGIAEDAVGAFSAGPINSAKILVYSF